MGWPVLWSDPLINNKFLPSYLAVLKENIGEVLLIYIPLNKVFLVSTAMTYEVDWYIFVK